MLSRPPGPAGRISKVVWLTLPPTLVAVLLYWPALELPLIYDDLLHIRIVKELDFVTVWLPAEAFGFYRPLTFYPLLLIKLLFGHYPAWLLHGLNVAQHGLNVALLVWLSWRLWRRPGWAMLAGFLLALFPFSYQAVTVYGHNVHPATAGLILLGLHTGLSALIGNGSAGRCWLVTVAFFILALLSHESAVLFGPFLALVIWNLPAADSAHSWPTRWRRWRPAVWFTLAGAAYALLYQLLPITRAPQAAGSGLALWPKILYLLQAATFPLSWLGRWLAGQPAVIILIALAMTLGLVAWRVRQPGNRPTLGLGWAWGSAASLLVALPLPVTYLLHGPRLLYLSSIGLAIVWAVLLDPWAARSRLARAAWLAVTVVVLLAGWWFVRGRLADYARLTRPLATVESVMSDRPVEEGVLLVNWPQWLAPERNTYPAGVEFVAMLGDYLFIEELLAENSGLDRPAQAVRVPDLLSAPGYGYAIHEQAAGQGIAADWAPAGSQLFVVHYEADGPVAGHNGGFSPAADSPAQPLAVMGPYELLEAIAEACQGEIRVLTTWQWLAAGSPAGEPLSASTSLFIQLLDPAGQLVAQADGPPLGLRPDLFTLPPGWQVLDRRVIPAAAGPMGQRIVLGVYDFATGQRYPARDSQGRPLPDSAYNLSLTTCP
jgi:hypothetical protein